MKPNFALNLTDDSIALLHRTARGWMEVGSTPLDAPDLGEALNYLRRSALGLAPHGIATKLVIPNSQILYLEVEAPGPDAAYRRAQIRKALEGRTPYAVEDLVFDWRGTGSTVQVAVIARETLDEAEQFAAQYRFNPVSFVAIPATSQFAGEPWFGPSALAATLLPAGEKVERDQDAVTIVARELPRETTRAEPVPAPAPVAAPMPPLPAGPVEEAPYTNIETPEDIAESMAEPTSPVTKVSAATTTGDADSTADTGKTPPVPEPQSKTDAIVADAFPSSVPDAPASQQANPEAPSFASRRAADLSPLPEAAPSEAAPANPAAETTPAQNRTAARASRRNGTLDADPAETRSSARPTPSPDTGLDTRIEPRLTPPPITPPTLSPVTDTLASAIASSNDAAEAKAAQTRKPLAAPVAADKNLRKETAAPVTAPRIPGRKPKAPVNTTARQTDAKTTMPGAFGTRKPPQRGKPRYLGLILTAILLLFLAVIAAWSSFYLASSGDPAPSATASEATADIPAVDDEMLADMQDPASLAQEAEAVGETAALAPAAEPAPAPEAIPPEAPATAQSAGPAPVADVDASPALSPSSDAQDEIFLAAVDARPIELDALALPKPDGMPDTAPAAQMPPPPFGTLYQFDANGLVKPTPDGIMSPEGVMLFAGAPARIPPPRPVELIAAAQAAAATVAATPALTTPTETAPALVADPALAGFKPRPRPADLAPPPAAAQPADDASLAIPEGSRLTSLRPRARPPAIVALADAARNATAAASLSAPADTQTEPQTEASLSGVGIAVSRKPVARPKDFTKAVEAAVAAAVQPTEEPAPEPAPAPEPIEQIAATPDAEPEPDVPESAPRATQRGTVAKQATFANAINLSKINLIGVYGTSNNRSAMIRQPNGRYKKVQVGDRVDGGTIAAITENEVRYQKGGRLISLKMPKG